MTTRKVTTIPAIRSSKIERLNDISAASIRKRRVAGYARVSTYHDEQVNSYEAQVDYYTRYIKSREDWEFVKIYTDEGISATNTRKRKGFNSMIADAKAGKIDLIITKSVSRFARNTVDSLTAVRELKDLGVEVYFEKENIWTLDSKGELLITIMSSLAQEESRSISENVTWGQRKRFADGKPNIPFSNVLGFERGEQGEIIVNKEQAEIVRKIFRMFLQGMTPYSIAKELTKQGIKSPMGKDKWCGSTIRRMLSNEKYKGDALLQKVYTVDFLQKKLKKNEGEVPQYYVEKNHEAIIDPQVFNMVQEELENRTLTRENRYSGKTVFSNKIKCGCCGGWYGPKVWHSNDKYKKKVYRCNRKYDSEKCDSPITTEEEIKEIFVNAVNQFIRQKDEIIFNLELINSTINNTDELVLKEKDLQTEIEKIVELTNKYTARNAAVTLNQDEYQRRYGELVNKYETLMEEYNNITNTIKIKKAQYKKISTFIEILKNQNEPVIEFDTTLWCGLIDYIVIGKDERIVVFKDGTSIKV